MNAYTSTASKAHSWHLELSLQKQNEQLNTPVTTWQQFTMADMVGRLISLFLADWKSASEDCWHLNTKTHVEHFTSDALTTCFNISLVISHRHNNAVGRRLVAGFCGQSASRMRPFHPAIWLQPAVPLTQLIGCLRLMRLHEADYDTVADNHCGNSTHQMKLLRVVFSTHRCQFSNSRYHIRQ